MGETSYRFTWDEYMATVNACAKQAKTLVARMSRRRAALATGPPVAALAAVEGALVEGSHELAEIQRIEWWLAGYVAQRSHMDAHGLALDLR